MAIGAPALLAVHAAIPLVHSAVQPALLAPHLTLTPGVVGAGLGIAQVLVAIGFVTGIADWVAAIGLLALIATVAVLFSPVEAVDQLYWAGIAVVVLVIGRTAVSAGQAQPWFQRRHAAWPVRTVAALRILAGLGIVGPALSEKIWNPEMGAAFLATHPQFNPFRTLLGWEWFGDDQFVLAAGIAEATIGVLLISGLLTRVVIAGMWLPFNVTVPLLPATELVGHLPLFGIMYFLLVHSAGIAPGEPLDRSVPPGVSARVLDAGRRAAGAAA
jgi:hypothetical protein